MSNLQADKVGVPLGVGTSGSSAVKPQGVLTAKNPERPSRNRSRRGRITTEDTEGTERKSGFTVPHRSLLHVLYRPAPSESNPPCPPWPPWSWPFVLGCGCVALGAPRLTILAAGEENQGQSGGAVTEYSPSSIGWRTCCADCDQCWRADNFKAPWPGRKTANVLPLPGGEDRGEGEVMLKMQHPLGESLASNRRDRTCAIL